MQLLHPIAPAPEQQGRTDADRDGATKYNGGLRVKLTRSSKFLLYRSCLRGCRWLVALVRVALLPVWKNS